MDDVARMFAVHVPVWELVVRASAMYLGLYFLLRLTPNRESGHLGLSNLLLIVVLADAAQNGMAGEYQSVTEGMIVVATIVGWSVVMDWASYRYPKLRWLLRSPPARVIVDGRMVRSQMRRELVSEEELLSALRKLGIEDVAEVAEARIEPDGDVSVVRRR